MAVANFKIKNRDCCSWCW